MAVDLYRREYKTQQNGIIGVTLVSIDRCKQCSIANFLVLSWIAEQRLV